MGQIVVLGESGAALGFALAGATVVVASEAGEVRRAWSTLALDVAVLVLGARAAEVLGSTPAFERPALLTIAMPE